MFSFHNMTVDFYTSSVRPSLTAFSPQLKNRVGFPLVKTPVIRIMIQSRCRFPEQSPSTNQLYGPRRRFVFGTNKRPRVCSVKNTHLKSSCHRVGNNNQTIPTPNTTRRVPVEWVRTTRSPAPVRGPTSPSTPHPPY